MEISLKGDNMRQVYVCMARCSKYLMISGKRCTCYNPQTFTCQAKKEPVFYSCEYIESILKEASKHGW